MGDEFWGSPVNKPKALGKQKSFHGTAHSSLQDLQTYLAQFEKYSDDCGKSPQGKFTNTGTSIGECKLFATLHILSNVKGKEDFLSSYANLSKFYQKMLGMPKV